METPPVHGNTLGNKGVSMETSPVHRNTLGNNCVSLGGSGVKKVWRGVKTVLRGVELVWGPGGRQERSWSEFYNSRERFWS